MYATCTESNNKIIIITQCWFASHKIFTVWPFMGRSLLIAVLNALNGLCPSRVCCDVTGQEFYL